MLCVLLHLVPCDASVYRVAVLKVICFLHFVGFLSYRELLSKKRLVCDDHLQIQHQVHCDVDLHVLVVVPSRYRRDFHTGKVTYSYRTLTIL